MTAIVFAVPAGVSVRIANGTTTVYAREIVAASLDRPLHRTATDRITAATPHIQSGTPGLLAGQITYLVDHLADALALDDVYKAAAPVTLTTWAPAGDMNGLKHHAVGTARMTAERATPGRPSKWLYTVEIREVP